MTLASALLTLALLACAATLCIGGRLLVRSSRRTQFGRGAIFLSIVIGALAVLIPNVARSGLQARSLAAPLEQVLPPVISIPAEMGRNDGHRGQAALSPVATTGQPTWSLIFERAERLRSQGDYAQAADTYAEVLVSAGDHLAARLGLAKALLEFGRYQEAELHVGRASAMARQDACTAPDLASAFSAVEQIREEFTSRLSGPLTTVQRQRLHASEQVRLTAIWKGSPWRITINVTDVREVLGELVIEGTLTADPALRICVYSPDQSHAQRSMGEQLTLTIVLTRWPSGPEAFDAREVRPGSRTQAAIAPPDIPLHTNAAKFSADGGTIQLSVAITAKGAGLIVRNDGVGIPEDELETIFDKFVHSSKTRSGAGGTGLGLSICREIVEALHGRIWCENHPEGGAVLRIDLPGEHSASDEMTARAEMIIGRSRGRPLRLPV